MVNLASVQVEFVFSDEKVKRYSCLNNPLNHLCPMKVEPRYAEGVCDALEKG